MKTKILIMTDSPLIDSGMGIVHRNIGNGLHENGFDVISIGWSPESSPGRSVPWHVYKTQNNKKDYYGEGIFDEVVKTERPDIVLTIGDVWNFAHISETSRTRGLFQWIGYTAIDGESYQGGIPPSWIPVINDMDKVITYTEYGKNAIIKSIPELKDDILVLPHGIDMTKFFPISDVAKQAMRKRVGIPDDVIIFLVVARNQFRKNIPEICKAWNKAVSTGKYSKAKLWLHMLFHDPCGWNMEEIIDITKIKQSIVYLEDFAMAQSNLQTIGDKELNYLYNIADVVVLVSGEGFGLPIAEAMACAKPLFVLNHSACAELVEGKGELIDVEYYVTGAHSTERPYPKYDSFIEKFDKLYNDVELRKEYGKRGYNYSRQFSNDLINKKWNAVINQMVNPFLGKCKLVKVC